MGGEDQEGAQEPAVTQDALLDVARIHAVLDERCLVRGNFMRSLPVDLGAVLRIFRRVRRVLVQRLVACGELRVTKECIVLLADLDDLRNLLIDVLLFDLFASV
jgi:hypothetical protein